MNSVNQLYAPKALGIRQEDRLCENHGPYIAKGLPPYTAERWTPCPECQDEQERAEAQAEKSSRQARLFESQLKAAGLDRRFLDKSFDNYVPRSGAQRKILEIVQAYVAEFPQNLEAGRCLGLLGQVGNGKTHLGVAVLREVILQDYSAKYVRAYDLYKAIKESWNSVGDKRSESETTREFTGPDLLVLDEVGVQFFTQAEETLMFQVIDSRYGQQKPTVIISNLGMPDKDKQREELADGDRRARQHRDVEDALGYRAYDRLTENGGLILEFRGPSFRNQDAGSGSGLEQAWQ